MEQLQLGSRSINQGRSDQMKIKTKIAFFLAPIILGAGAAFGADAAANWNQHCASCHGKDGSGSTTMGKKLGVKDYRDAKVQAAFSDGEVESAIKDGVKEGGKQKMKPFKDKLADEDVKALVAYVRSLKK
jgi:mono/diheme cytochrome c family protein